MAQGLFIVGFTVAEIKAIQARAKELLLDGKTIMSTKTTETEAEKQFTMPIREVLEECAYALQVLDPATYKRVVVRTVPRYIC